jgi:putative SOS response-associated peptidase YedK
MCGKYRLGTADRNGRLQEIFEEADASLPTGLHLKAGREGDVCPTDLVPGIVARAGETHSVGMRWGFRTEGGLVINARAETALERPLFRESASERRCLLPATGYYEWNAHKERFLFRRSGGGILYLAGLHRAGEKGVSEFVILTREASGEARGIHARMPLIVSSIEEWLLDRAAAQQILATGGDANLEIVRQSPEQLSLFDDF